MFAEAGLDIANTKQGQGYQSAAIGVSASLTAFSSYSAYSLSSNRADKNATADIVSLSQQAQNYLQNGQDNLSALAQAQKILSDDPFAALTDQLSDIRSKIEDIFAALSGSGSTSDISSLLSATEQNGFDLRAIGQTLGLVPSTGAANQASSQSLSVTTVNLTASFNSVTRIETAEGEVLQIEETQQIELNYVQIAYSEQRYSANSDFEFPKDVRDDFLLTAKGFLDLADELQKALSSEDRFPPSLTQVIRDILSASLDGSTTHLVDQAA